MTRWFLMLLTCLALALGPSVDGIAAACQPAPVASDLGCGESCCCGDQTQCPCVRQAPDHSEKAPAAPRPTNEPRPLLLPAPVNADAVIAVPTGFIPVGAARDPMDSKVRSQARLCRWRN